MSGFDFTRTERDPLSRQRFAARLTGMDGAELAFSRIAVNLLGYGAPPPHVVDLPWSGRMRIVSHDMKAGSVTWDREPVFAHPLKDVTAGSLVACWINGGTLPRTDER